MPVSNTSILAVAMSLTVITPPARCRAGDRQVSICLSRMISRCLAQAGGAGDAGHLAVIHIADLGFTSVHMSRRLDPELFEHEFGLLVHLAGAAGLADKIAGLVFQLCIGNGRADGVGVRVAVPDDHDLMGCFGHNSPPFFGSASYQLYGRVFPARTHKLWLYFSTIICGGKVEQTHPASFLFLRCLRCILTSCGKNRMLLHSSIPQKFYNISSNNGGRSHEKKRSALCLPCWP